MKQQSERARKAGFNIHACVFVLAMSAQGIINLLTGPPWWALWVLPGWGVGLFMHWWLVLGPGAGAAKPGE